MRGNAPQRPPEAGNPGMPPVLTDFAAFRNSLFSEPAHDPAWQPQHLDYDFALGSPVPDENLLLNAPDFPGGHLDWYSFNLQTAQANQVTSTSDPTAHVNQVASTSVPTAQHDVEACMSDGSTLSIVGIDVHHTATALT